MEHSSNINYKFLKRSKKPSKEASPPFLDFFPYPKKVTNVKERRPATKLSRLREKAQKNRAGKTKKLGKSLIFIANF